MKKLILATLALVLFTTAAPITPAQTVGATIAGNLIYASGISAISFTSNSHAVISNNAIQGGIATNPAALVGKTFTAPNLAAKGGTLTFTTPQATLTVRYSTSVVNGKRVGKILSETYNVSTVKPAYGTYCLIYFTGIERVNGWDGPAWYFGLLTYDSCWQKYVGFTPWILVEGGIL